jgi:hypothetical protein
LKTAGVLVRTFVLVAAAAVSSACGVDDPLNLPAATGPSPFVAQLGGQWAGSSTLVSVNGLLGSPTGCVGGDVLGRILGGVLPSDDVALTLTQDSSAISGRFTSSGTGLACTYTGTAALTGVVLDAKACDAPALIVRCETEGVRDLTLIGSAVVGSVSGRAMSGTVTNTYNVLQEGQSDVSLVLKYSYSVVKQ